MIAHIPRPDNSKRGSCGTVLLGIAAPPEAERCVVRLELDDNHFREEGGRSRGADHYTSHPGPRRL
jgi:hypothetical protein